MSEGVKGESSDQQRISELFAAFALVDGAPSLTLILLIGLWADCRTASLIC